MLQKGFSLLAKKIALLAREAVLDKKAEEPIILDVGKLTSVARYFLVTHGNSDRQVRAVAQHVMEVLKEHKVALWHVEGMEEGRWVLLDFGSLIAHIFYRETRAFYGLERLWGEAKQL
jgi:ribosome-associated protein